MKRLLCIFTLLPMLVHASQAPHNPHKRIPFNDPKQNQERRCLENPTQNEGALNPIVVDLRALPKDEDLEAMHKKSIAFAQEKEDLEAQKYAFKAMIDHIAYKKKHSGNHFKEEDCIAVAQAMSKQCTPHTQYKIIKAFKSRVRSTLKKHDPKAQRASNNKQSTQNTPQPFKPIVRVAAFQHFGYRQYCEDTANRLIYVKLADNALICCSFYNMTDFQYVGHVAPDQTQVIYVPVHNQGTLK